MKSRTFEVPHSACYFLMLSSTYSSQYPAHEHKCVFLCDSGMRHSVVWWKGTNAAEDHYVYAVVTSHKTVHVNIL